MFPCLQDDTALLFLGQCFESGFGVQQNLRTAIEYYKRAAQAGNKQAKSLLTPPSGKDIGGKDTCCLSISISHSILGIFSAVGAAFDMLLMRHDSADIISLFCRRHSIAFHPLSSVFLCSRLFHIPGRSRPSLHQSPRHPNPPASLLEHREPRCSPTTVLHASSSPPPQH